MKKTLSVIALCMTVAVGVSSAQSLSSILGAVSSAAGSSSGSDILNTVSKVVYAYTGKTDAVSLPGNWSYTGVAVDLESENVLANVAGTAASSSVETKIDNYLQKAGITSGSIKFTFNEDLTFACTMKGIPLSGTWKTDNDKGTVTLQFGKLLSYMSMTGTLESSSNGCRMLFNGKKFLSFMKAALQVVASKSATAQTVSSLAGSYSNMKIGFELKSVK